MSRKYKIDRDRIDKIFFGELKGRREDFLVNKNNKFVYAFLCLTEIVVGRVNKIDEARLEASEEPLEYLKNVENVYAYYFQLDYGWHRREMGPFIGFLDEKKIPVILTFRNGRYYLFNPEDGSKVYVDKTIASRISDEALAILPKSSNGIKNGRKLLFNSVKKQKKECLIFLLLTIISTIISAVVPLFAGYITNTMIPNNLYSGILVISISLILGILAGLMINIVINRTKKRIEANISYDTFAAILARVMNMNGADEKKLSDRIIALMTPFMSAVDVITNSFLGGFVFLMQGLMVISTTFSIDSKNNNIIYDLVAAEVLIVVIMQFIVYKKTSSVRDSEARLSAMRREMLDNMEVIKTGAIEDRILYRFAIEYDERMRLRLDIGRISQNINIIGTLISGLGIFLLFWHFSYLEFMEIGKISAMVTSFTLMVSYINSMSMSFSEVAGSLPYLEFADTVLKVPLEASDEGAADHIISGKIEISNLTFAYGEESNPVIRGLNLTIDPGEYVGIVGASGCGKSTLMRLLLGLLSPSEGHISYDGIDIGQYNIKSLRKQMGVVLQDAAVITGTIRHNIGFTEDADMERVTEAARQAAVLEDIEAMPMKFNTMLSGEAEVISGGQRQRIVLARALMNKPKILFLDEATSAVDNKSQKIIKENLDKMGITRVAIAHRLSTVINCDRIIVMDKGMIAEEGTFTELMEKNGIFTKLAERNIL